MGLRAIPLHPRQIKPAMPANPQILPALGAPQGTAKGISVFNGGTTVPTHTLIIIPHAIPDNYFFRPPY
ncbi:hypothetical protein AGMMS4952_10860 [Spirochaetia bacterium]|nr:hypothetical protein AGMMS4952_10860 [Spirochaetia bacterium]